MSEAVVEEEEVVEEAGEEPQHRSLIIQHEDEDEEVGVEHPTHNMLLSLNPSQEWWPIPSPGGK